MITIKTLQEIELMRRNAQDLCVLLAEVLVRALPGVSTATLDAAAEASIRAQGAVPAFKGYRGFPGSICASINDEIVHGIPSPTRVLREGDVLSVDIGMVRDGFFADTAATVCVGKTSQRVERLVAANSHALRLGIEQARVGNRVGDISHVIGDYIVSQGYGVVKNFVGHGIGRQMHEDPSVPNFGKAGKGAKLRPGMVLAIEPMAMEDVGAERVLDDGWTVVTPQGGLAVHLEEMVLITEGQPELLTDGHSLRAGLEPTATGLERVAR